MSLSGTILAAIITLQPNVQMQYAQELADAIAIESLTADESVIAVAVAMQESSLLRLTHGPESYGTYQLHEVTIKNYGIVIRDLSTIRGEVQAYFLIMRDKQRICDHLIESWTCFHSFTPIHRDAYSIAVNRWLALLNTRLGE